MDKDRQIAKDKFEEYTLIEKIKYYWDYYKYRYLFAMLIILLASYTVYNKMTEINYDLEVGLYAYEFYGEEAETGIEKTLTGWLEGEYADENEHLVGINSMYMVEHNGYNEEAVIAANTKLNAELASGKNTGFILDEKTYDDYFVNGGYGAVQDKEYTCEIGGNVKKILGLNKEKTYYYVTIYSASAKNGIEKEVLRYENAKKICDLIRKQK